MQNLYFKIIQLLDFFIFDFSKFNYLKLKLLNQYFLIKILFGYKLCQ